MGVADTIPGVSGGTVAFISGIYEELVESLARLGPARLRDLREGGPLRFWQSINGSFLLAVFGGAVIALFAVAELMNWLLNHHRVVLWAFFFGLILASVPLVLTRMRRWRPGHLLWGGAGIVVGLGVTLLTPGSTPDALWMVFLAGMIAISAMVLPGISGSFLLLLMNKYETMVAAVVERDLLLIAIFGAGAVIGILSVSRLLSALYHRHHDATVALLTGFMFGSLNALWPWQDEAGAGGLAGHYWPWQYEAATGSPPQFLAVLICFALGIGLIAWFARFDPPPSSLADVGDEVA
jgi:putative membrane protein